MKKFRISRYVKVVKTTHYNDTLEIIAEDETEARTIAANEPLGSDNEVVDDNTELLVKYVDEPEEMYMDDEDDYEELTISLSRPDNPEDAIGRYRA